MEIQIKKVDFNNEKEGHDLIAMLQHYAMDLQGGEEPLSDYTTNNLIAELKKSPIAVSFLAYDNETPVGLANCFYGFSTFSAKTLLNVHDLVVKESTRGLGVGTQLLLAAETEARLKGCCKVTLEVLQNNSRAQKVYSSFGFSGYYLGAEDNKALFWEKKL